MLSALVERRRPDGPNTPDGSFVIAEELLPSLARAQPHRALLAQVEGGPEGVLATSFIHGFSSGNAASGTSASPTRRAGSSLFRRAWWGTAEKCLEPSACSSPGCGAAQPPPAAWLFARASRTISRVSASSSTTRTTGWVADMLLSVSPGESRAAYHECGAGPSRVNSCPRRDPHQINGGLPSWERKPLEMDTGVSNSEAPQAPVKLVHQSRRPAQEHVRAR